MTNRHWSVNVWIKVNIWIVSMFAVTDTEGQGSTGISVADTSLPLPTTTCSMTKKEACKPKSLKVSASPGQSKAAVFFFYQLNTIFLFSCDIIFRIIKERNWLYSRLM